MLKIAENAHDQEIAVSELIRRSVQCQQTAGMILDMEFAIN